MNVEETKLTLKYSPFELAILLKANHGVGKSAVVRQAAGELGISFIDIRLAQNDVGDMKGLPFQAAGRTFFAPPDWFPIKGEDAAMLSKSLNADDLEKSVSEITTGKFGDKGILFLDEINRATQEVQQAAFELVLDRRLNMRDLPSGWRVVAAINSNADLYDVNEMGVALISRFKVIDFNPTVEEWWKWAATKEYDGNIGLHPAVQAFTKKYSNFLDPTDEIIQEAQAECNRVYDRRSWEMLSNDIYSFQKNVSPNKMPFDIMAKTPESNSFLLLTATGLLGSICAVKFKNFVELEYKVLDAEKIIESMDKTVEKHIVKLVNDGKIPEVASYNNQIVDYIKKNIDATTGLNAKQSKNLFEYVKLIPNEIVSNLWKSLLQDCKDVATKWYEGDDKITSYIGSVFTV